MTRPFRKVGTRIAIAISVIVAAHILAGPRESLAQPFSIVGLGSHGQGFQPGQLEFQARNAYQTGFPVDDDSGTLFGTNLSATLALADYLKVKGGLNLRQHENEDLLVTNAVFAATLAPELLRWDHFTAGLYLQIEPRIGEDATNEFIFGPVFQFDLGDTFDVTLDPFFKDTFGTNSSDGLDFSYRWRVRGNFAPGFGAGLEGYGTIDDVFGHPPNSQDQIHRAGPVVYLNEELFGWQRGVDISFGVLAGLTTETPEAAFRLNIEFELGP